MSVSSYCNFTPSSLPQDLSGKIEIKLLIQVRWTSSCSHEDNLNTVEQAKFASAIISRMRELVSHSRSYRTRSIGCIVTLSTILRTCQLVWYEQYSPDIRQQICWYLMRHLILRYAQCLIVRSGLKSTRTLPYPTRRSRV